MVAVAVVAAEKKQPLPAETAATVELLSKQIDLLQTKLNEVEKRLTKLETEKSNPVVGALPLRIVPRIIQNQNTSLEPFADRNHPPKIWGEGECNGWKYYVIPLSASSGGTVTPIPLAGDVNLGR